MFRPAFLLYYLAMDNEKDFDPDTMTMATAEDVFRMWRRLWGESTLVEIEYVRESFESFDMEMRDLTQINHG